MPIALSGSLAAADATVRAKIVEIQTKVATYCVSFPPQGQLACQVAVVTGSVGIEGAECVTRGVVDGAPLSEGSRGLAKAALDVVFDLNARGAFLNESRQLARAGPRRLRGGPGLNERGQGSLTDAGQINATWTNVNGSGSAYGTVFSIDDRRRARRITWNNGILFDRP